MLIDRQDVLYAVRSARRTPLLTFVVVLALSVGIGLNAGVFTILNSISPLSRLVYWTASGLILQRRRLRRNSHPGALSR
jgi:hypothetical protein